MSENINKELIPQLGMTSNVRTLVYSNTNSYYSRIDSSDGNKTISEENEDSEVKTEMYYINNTSKDFTIMGRDGLAFIVKHRPSISKPNFIIRKIISIRGHALNSAIKCISNISVIEATDLEHIKNKLSLFKISKFSDIKIVIDYIVNPEDVVKAIDSTIYHQQTDLVVSLKDVTSVAMHPFSSRFTNIGAFGNLNDFENIDRNNLNIKIRYVNHNPHASNKYINILGKVRILYPERNAPFRCIKVRGITKKDVEFDVTDYIEVISTNKNSPDNSQGGLNIERYTLEDAKNILGAYDTFIEACGARETESVRKIELAELEHRLTIDKLEYQRDKAKLDKEADERKADLNNQAINLQREKNEFELNKQKLENDRAILDKEMQEVKTMRAILDLKMSYQNFDFERETREYNLRREKRKDTIDTIKFIPGLIIAISGLVGIYAKINSKS